MAATLTSHDGKGDILEFLSFFLVGGLVVGLTTLVGAKGHGSLAAFIGMFPSMTVLIFLLLYRSGGNPAVTGYAKSLVNFVVPWVLYVLAVSFLCERLGIWWSLGIGVAAFLSVSWVFMQFR